MTVLQKEMYKAYQKDENCIDKAKKLLNMKTHDYILEQTVKHHVASIAQFLYHIQIITRKEFVEYTKDLYHYAPYAPFNEECLECSVHGLKIDWEHIIISRVDLMKEFGS